MERQDVHRAGGKISLSIVKVTRIEELGNATLLKIFIISDACVLGKGVEKERTGHRHLIEEQLRAAKK